MFRSTKRILELGKILHDIRQIDEINGVTPPRKKIFLCIYLEIRIILSNLLVTNRFLKLEKRRNTKRNASRKKSFLCFKSP